MKALNTITTFALGLGLAVTVFFIMDHFQAERLDRAWDNGYNAAIHQWRTGEDVTGNGVNPFSEDNPFDYKDD